jgi:hypothetical protein
MRPRDRRRGQAAVIDGDKPIIDGFAMAKEANICNARNNSVTSSEMPGRQATSQQTRAAIRTNLSESASSQLADLLNSDLKDVVPVHFDNDIEDTTNGVERRTPENLPAIVSTAIANTDGMIIPKWHKISNLQGYRAEQIRAAGRQIFGMFTDTPIEDIQACTTCSNDVEEVQAMMAWIKKNGVRNEKMEMDFNQLMRGYKADAQSWDAEGFSFLLVRDSEGHYVYGWPGGRGVHLTEDAPRPMLR